MASSTGIWGMDTTALASAGQQTGDVSAEADGARRTLVEGLTSSGGAAGETTVTGALSEYEATWSRTASDVTRTIQGYGDAITSTAREGERVTAETLALQLLGLAGSTALLGALQRPINA